MQPHPIQFLLRRPIRSFETSELTVLPRCSFRGTEMDEELVAVHDPRTRYRPSTFFAFAIVIVRRSRGSRKNRIAVCHFYGPFVLGEVSPVPGVSGWFWKEKMNLSFPRSINRVILEGVDPRRKESPTPKRIVGNKRGWHWENHHPSFPKREKRFTLYKRGGS